MYRNSLATLLDVDTLADAQRGPTCGFEAVENVIQQFHSLPNTLSHSDLIGRASRRGCLLWSADGPMLDPRGYSLLLSDYGVEADWYAFNHQVLIYAVRQKRGVIAVVDGHRLCPSVYSIPGSWHAVTITSLTVDAFGKVVEYIGIDSNFPNGQVRWNSAAFGQAASAWMYAPLLITKAPARRQQIVQYYRKNFWTGSLIAVR